MTASSAEFFPCRVQLMGLPRSCFAATNNLWNQDDSTTRPQFAKIQRISRNLFGTPDRDEINHFYRQETERQRSYVLSRYNFDTRLSKPTNEREKHATEKSNIEISTNHTIHEIQFPTLIEQELRQHEQRLENEEQRLSRVYLETTPSNEKTLSDTGRRSYKYSTSPYPASERQKHNARQSFLTESFTLRKNKESVTINSEKIALKNDDIYHRNHQTLQLPSSINSNSDRKDKRNELSTLEDVYNQETNKTDTSYNDNCKSFSLQVVVSTQNAS